MEADFSGWASQNGLKCSDGRTIMPGAFKHQDKQKVPLVWQHQHDGAENILGHAILENRPEGVYAYGYFNETDPGQHAKAMVQHGDIDALSIYARQLIEQKKNVLHGNIHEVSLVLSGANPGAYIDNVTLAHGDDEYEELDDEAIIYTGLSLEHENQGDAVATKNKERTVQDVFDTFNDEQKQVLFAMVGEALEHSGDIEEDVDDENEEEVDDEDEDDDTDDDNEEDTIQHSKKGQKMTRNVFEQNGKSTQAQPTLTHAQLTEIVEDAKKHGSLKESFLAHAVDYGIEDIDLLFPDAKAVDGNAPEWIKRRTEWVSGVINGTRHSPFAKIKSLSADITHEEARAKGYIKANLKKDQFFKISKRETGPKTIYKKQKLDRDDLIDIVDLDVIAWMKAEMRVMLDEEIARAVLIGDGRDLEDEDKIDEEKIRPIASDDEFYTHPINVAPNVSGNTLLETILRERKHYKGSGNPTFYTTEDVVTDLILLKDKMGRRLYVTEAELASALRVSNIVTVEVMEGHTNSDGAFLIGILVNINDYTIGSNAGGAVTLFDDFDIDFNQHKYLIETRISGALTRHKTAMAIWRAAGELATPTAPTFNAVSGVVTIPSSTGVIYSIDDVPVDSGPQSAIDYEETVYVTAAPAEGYYFTPGSVVEWEFTRNPE